MTFNTVPSKLPRLQIVVEPEMRKAIEKLCSKQERTVSQLVRLWIKEKLSEAIEEGELESEYKTWED